VISWLRRWLQRQQPGPTGVSDRGMLVYPSTGEVIRAETLLRSCGVEVAVKAPPPALRQGCDMVVEFPLVEEMRVRSILEEHRLVPLRVVTVEDPLLEPVSLFHTTEMDGFLMVRAANMKITVDLRDGRIVNVSGGGCPDVPYLAGALVGKTLAEAPAPRSLGQTLCGYALQLAFEEAKRRWTGLS
jgi:hypothetical protein